MRRFIVLVLMLIAVTLAGCRPQVQATPSSTATAEAHFGPTAVSTALVEPARLPDSVCTVVTQKPTPGPTAESAIPPVSDKDWVKGPASAKVTIIEYSDFQ